MIKYLIVALLATYALTATPTVYDVHTGWQPATGHVAQAFSSGSDLALGA